MSQYHYSPPPSTSHRNTHRDARDPLHSSGGYSGTSRGDLDGEGVYRDERDRKHGSRLDHDYDERQESLYGPTRHRDRERRGSDATPYPAGPSTYESRRHTSKGAPTEYYKPLANRSETQPAVSRLSQLEHFRMAPSTPASDGSPWLIDLNTPEGTPPLIQLESPSSGSNPNLTAVPSQQPHGVQGQGQGQSRRKNRKGKEPERQSEPSTQAQPTSAQQTSKHRPREMPNASKVVRPPPRRDPYKERMAARVIDSLPAKQHGEQLTDRSEETIRRLEAQQRQLESKLGEQTSNENENNSAGGSRSAAFTSSNDRTQQRLNVAAREGHNELPKPLSRVQPQPQSRAGPTQPTTSGKAAAILSLQAARKMSSVHPWGPNTVPFVSAWTMTLSNPDPRLNVPKHLLYPVAYPPSLGHQILRSWVLSSPSGKQKDDVARVVREVETALRTRYGFAGVVEPFGSVSWGAEVQSDKACDLDLMLRDFDRPLGYTENLWNVGGPNRNKNLPQVYNVDDVARYLANKGYKNIEPVRHAATPIVKFRDWRTSISCDLNVNDLGGFYNSSLMAAYCRLSPFVLRPLICLVKMWAKARNLNDSAGATGASTLSSYCYGLMCVAYLQSEKRLPNLQDPERVRKAGRTDCHAWVGWGKDEGTYLCADFVDDLDPEDPEFGRDWDNSRPDSRDPWGVADAARGFFEFYSMATDPRISGEGLVRMQTHAFSVRGGGAIERGRKRDNAGLKLIQSEDAEYELQKKAELLRQKEAELIEAALLDDEGNGVPNTETAMLPKPAALSKKRKLRMKAKSDRPRSADGQPYEWCKANLVVPDPFLVDKNAARSMEKTYGRFVDELLRARDILREPNADIAHLLHPAPPPPPSKAAVKAQKLAANQARLLEQQRINILKFQAGRR